ncbi:hypothetical protein ABPG72_004702 [Tetrahymena utriculariae]
MKQNLRKLNQAHELPLDRKASINGFMNLKVKEKVQNESNLTNSKRDLKQALQSIKIKQKIGNIVDKTAIRRFQKLQKENFRMLNDAAIILQDKQSSKNNEADYLVDKNDFSFLEKLDQLFPPFNPCSRIKLLWDVIQMFFSICIIYIIPIHLIFEIDLMVLVSPYVVYTIIPLSLIVDICVNLNTACFLKGTLTNNRKIIFKNYIRQDFKYDIIANIPLFIYCLCYIKSSPSDQYSVYRFITLTCFYKVYQFNRVFKRVEDEFPLSTQTSNIISLVKLFLSIILNLHISALAWLIIGFIQIKQGETNTWMNAASIANSEWHVQYIYSYYFSTVTMITVGYGDISPHTIAEKILSIINMMIACGQFAYSVNSIGNIFEQFFRLDNEIQANMKIINRYMTNKTISKNLQYQVREYLEYYWKQEKSNNTDLEVINYFISLQQIFIIYQIQVKILNQLSHKLKETLLMEANKIALRESPIFSKNFSEQIIQKTVPLIKEIRCTPEEIIYLKGDQDDFAIYFIEKGQVEAFTYQKTPFNKKMKTINSLYTLGKGQFFGEYSFFTGEPRDINIKSLEFTTLLKIKRADLITLLKDSPDDFEIFCMIRDSATFNSEKSSILSKCQCCNEFEHSISYCPLIHNVPNKFNVIRLHSTGREQTREKIKRRRDKKKENTYFHNYDYQIRMEDFVNDNMEEIRAYFRKYFIEMLRIDSNDSIPSSDMFEEYGDEEEDDELEDFYQEDFADPQNQLQKKSQLFQNLPQRSNILNINTQLQNLNLVSNSISQKIVIGVDQKFVNTSSSKDLDQNQYLENPKKSMTNSEDKATSSNRCIQAEEDKSNISDQQNQAIAQNITRKQSRHNTIGAKKMSKIQNRSESIFILQKRSRGSSINFIAQSILDMIRERNLDPLETILELMKLNQNQCISNNPNHQLNKETSISSPNQQQQVNLLGQINSNQRDNLIKKQTFQSEQDKHGEQQQINYLFQDQQQQQQNFQESTDDTARNYKFYYPQHNLSNIIENVLEKRRQKREDEKKKIELLFQQQLLQNVNIKPRAKSGQVKIVQIANRSQKRPLNRVSSDIRKLDKIQKLMSFKQKNSGIDDEEDDQSSCSSETSKIESNGQASKYKLSILKQQDIVQLKDTQLDAQICTNQQNRDQQIRDHAIKLSLKDEQKEEDIQQDDFMFIQPIQQEFKVYNSFFQTKYSKCNDTCDLYNIKFNYDQQSEQVSQHKLKLSQENI